MWCSVAKVSFGFACGVFLAGCGGPVELETGEAYCTGQGGSAKHPQITYCDSFERIMLAREDGTLESISAGNAFQFKEVGRVDGNSIEITGETGTIKAKGDAYRLMLESAGSERIWLFKTDNVTAGKVERYDAALQKLDPDQPMPTRKPAYVDVPLCYEENYYRGNSGPARNSNSGCSSVNFFSSTGQIVKLRVDTLNDPNGPTWQNDGTWSRAGNIGRPDAYKDFTWKRSSEGSPISERKSHGQRYGPYAQQVELAYPFYTGSKREQVQSAYEEIYPNLRRQKLVRRHFPELAQQ